MTNYGNPLNLQTNGIVKVNNGPFSTITVTQHDVLVGASANGITSVAPSSTSGVPLISQGSSSDPAFGTVVVAGGGTGATTLTGVLIGNGTSAVTASAVTQYDVLVGGSSNAISSVGPGSAGQVLQSAGNAANPAYSTPTYPSASGSTGTILRSDGTNNVYTTATYPATTGANTMLISTSANAVTTTTYQATTTFTPAVNVSASTTGITYTTQVGTYAQIGSVVFINIYIVLSNKGANGGAVTITGLPVTSNSTSNNNQIIKASLQNTSFFSTTYDGMMYLAPSSTTLQMYGTFNSNGSFSAFSGANITNTSTFIISGSYLA